MSTTRLLEKVPKGGISSEFVVDSWVSVSCW